MPREKAQAAPTARPKVPMRRLGAHCLVVVMKRGNARGAKGVGHQRWIGSTSNGRNPIINGRRQPSLGGTSRMMREYHVRICEGLGVQFPGSTRQSRQIGDVRDESGSPPIAPALANRSNNGLGQFRPRCGAEPHYRSVAAEMPVLSGLSYCWFLAEWI